MAFAGLTGATGFCAFCTGAFEGALGTGLTTALTDLTEVLPAAGSCFAGAFARVLTTGLAAPADARLAGTGFDGDAGTFVAGLTDAFWATGLAAFTAGLGTAFDFTTGLTAAFAEMLVFLAGTFTVCLLWKPLFLKPRTCTLATRCGRFFWFSCRRAIVAAQVTAVELVKQTVGESIQTSGSARFSACSAWTAESLPQTRHCSRPWRKISLGRSIPMKTILLVLFSPLAQAGPKSLPMSWCTPWKITLRSVPSIFSTPL